MMKDNNFDLWLMKDNNLEPWVSEDGLFPTWKKRVLITDLLAQAWENVCKGNECTQCKAFDFLAAVRRQLQYSDWAQHDDRRQQ